VVELDPALGFDSQVNFKSIVAEDVCENGGIPLKLGCFEARISRCKK
jgi:hypothetical protein